jgi:hypothetical protein
MKKSLLLGFLMLFVLSTAMFAGVTDPKKDSDKTTKEYKHSDLRLTMPVRISFS